MGIFVISLKQNKGFFTHPKRILFFVISSFVLTSFFMIEMRDAFAVAGINETINFQGRVANTDGTNVANGNYDFVFRLYKASSGGSAQWTETWNSGTSQVEVTNGIFRVALGTHASLSSLDFNDDSWYLSVEFNGDGEMDPRIQFASVPYALNAKTVSGLTVTNTTGTFTLANGKTFVVNNGLTFSGADSTAFVFPSTGGNVVTEDFAQTLTNKTIGSTGLTFSGATTDITTVSNENFVLSPNGTGRIGFGTTTPSAFFDVAGAASVSGQLALYTTPQIQSTNNQTLIIGGDTTGFINLRPLDGLGTVIVNSTAFEVHSASGFGNATNYTSIDADGDLSFVGTADYLIAAGGKYAFRYAGDEDYGLFFDDGAASYDFRNGSAANVFRISASSGALVSAAYTTNGGLIYSTSTGVFTQLGTGTTGQCLTANTSAAPSWSSCGTGGSSNWVINSGTGIINPINNTLDFLVGGTATSSAKFAVLGVASDSPIASLSASTGFGVSLGYNGVIQTTRNQTLTLGGDSTGNIILSPLNGTGIVTVNGILDAVTGGGSTFVVAANDSPARMKAQADYVADGTADEVQIQAAIDALPSTGGQIQLAQGTYNLSSTVSITANKRIRILGYGAILRPAASTTAITVNQGISNAQGAIIEGVTINGQNNSGTTGILLEDTNNPAVYNVRITNVSIGIHINSEETNEFVEGLAIEDVLIRDCVAGGTGISMTTNDGTGSFAQHQWRTVKIANCDTGINLAYPSQFYRSYIENATIWIGENQNGIVIDGDVLLSRMEINVEAATGSSGHTAITIGSNATNTEHLDFYYTQTGTVDTILSNSSNKFFTYKKNRNWFTSGSMPALQMYAHGDSQERLGFRTSFAGGGGLLFGPGGATVPDTNLYRAGVDSLKTDDSFTVGSNLIIEFPGGTPAVNTSTEGFQSASIGNLDMHARGSYRIFMDSNTNSSDNLRIFGDGTSKELLRLEESGGKALLSINNFWTSQDIFTASASGATKLRLDSTGNLGLGVLGADTIEGQIHVRAINDGGDATLVLDADRGDDNADKWSIISQASDSDLSFANHTSEVFKISAAGSIYVAGGQSIDTLSNNTLAIGTTNATTLTLGRTGQGITLPGFDCSALGNGGKITTTSGGVLTCSNDTSGSGGSSNWVLNSTDGTLSPINNTLDLLLGGAASNSAKFAVLNVADGIPVASLSAGTSGGLYFTADGTIQTTATQNLTIGGDTTGDINISAKDGAGNVGVSADLIGLFASGGIGLISPSTYVSGVVELADVAETIDEVGEIYWTSQGGSNGIFRFVAENFSGGEIAQFRDGANSVFQVHGTGGTSVFEYNLDVLGNLGVGGHLALGSDSSISSTNILNIIETYSGTSDFTGINTQITKSTATGEFYGIVANPIYTGSGNNSASNFIGVNSVPFYAGSGNMVNSIGIYSQAASIQTGSSGVIGSAYGLYVGDPSAIGGTGTITDNIGIYVAPMTRGVTSDVGIGVDAAQTQTLWLDAHGSSTTSNAGIAFGSARDTLLYRSGSNTLTTGYLQLARLIFPSVSSFDGSIDTISAYILGDITTSARGDIRFVIDSNNNSNNMFRILANSNSNEIVNINESGSIFTAAGTVHDTLTAGTLGIGTTTATTITIGRSGQGITLPGFTGGGTGCTTLTTNGSGVLTCGTAVSQTPWTSDIDADNFSLLDLGTNITSRNGLTLGTGSGGNLTLTPNGTGDVIVSGDGDTNFQVNFSAPPTTNMAVISNSGQGTTTNGVNGLVVDFTQGDDGDATDGNVALLVDVTSSSGDSDALIGLFIDSITGGAAEEIALVIGQGWDAGLIISSGGATNSGLVYSGDGRPTKTITLSPEYSGAVLTDYYGAGTDTNITGAMTSDADTTQGTSIRNYYQWERTTDSTQHFYTVAVRVTLPADFDDWTTSNAVRVSYITESATNTVSDVDVRIYNENDSTIVASDLDNASTSWATVDFAGSTLNDDSSSEWDAAGETAVIYLRMGSASSNYVRVGDIQLNYLAKF